MSFQDELNNNSKTSDELDKDLKDRMDSKAYSQYHDIKEYMLSKARDGEYISYGSKKKILIYQEMRYDLKNLIVEEEVPTQMSYGFLNLQKKTLIKRRFVINESKRKEYNYFIDSIKKYAQNDGMEIMPVIYSESEDIEYTIPTPIVGIYLVGYKFCLKCTIVY